MPTKEITKPEIIEEADIDEQIKFKGKYMVAIGKRKTSVAQVRLFKGGKGVIVVNGQKLNEYFSESQISAIYQPLKLTNAHHDFNFSVVVSGGGKSGQSEAIRHGISRVLIKINEELKPALKAKGLMTRDARKKERKKPGLKKARKAPQWSKR